jgi:TetR/AcrR family transcriptional repressor of mexJK operon
LTVQRRTVGRPTREQAAAIELQLLDYAEEAFLNSGFDQVAMAEIAQGLAMSKRTLYSRYANKEDLFQAVLQRLVGEYQNALQYAPATAKGDLRAALFGIAQARLMSLNSDRGRALQRLLSMHTYRFPQEVLAAHQNTMEPTMHLLTQLISQSPEVSAHIAKDPGQAASAFMALALGAPARLLLTGKVLSGEEIQERLSYSVDLFLRGICADVGSID